MKECLKNNLMHLSSSKTGKNSIITAVLQNTPMSRVSWLIPATMVRTFRALVQRFDIDVSAWMKNDRASEQNLQWQDTGGGGVFNTSQRLF